MTTDQLKRAILDYEIRSSWWASWISNNWLQEISASWFAWKVNRKFRRWVESRQGRMEWMKDKTNSK